MYRQALEAKQKDLLSMLETIQSVQRDVEAHRSELEAQGECVWLVSLRWCFL